MSCDPALHLQVCSTLDVCCTYEGCQSGHTYAARLRVVGEEPVTYGKFTDPVQFTVPAPPTVVEDTQLPRSQAAESLEGHTASSSLSAVQTVVSQKLLAPLLFLVLSGLVVGLAFVVGVYFKF